MWSCLVIVAEIFLQNSSKVLFGEHNHVIKKLSTNTSNYSFDEWILPGRMRRSDQFFDLHSFDSTPKFRSINRISIPQQKTWGSVFRKGLDHLLRRPGSGRMKCHVEMNDAPSAVQKNNKAVKIPKLSSGNNEKIDAGDVMCVIGEKCLPRLRWRFAYFDSIFGDGRFRNVETEETEFRLYSRRTPKWILARHSADEVTDFGIDFWSTNVANL